MVQKEPVYLEVMMQKAKEMAEIVRKGAVKMEEVATVVAKMLVTFRKKLRDEVQKEEATRDV